MPLKSISQQKLNKSTDPDGKKNCNIIIVIKELLKIGLVWFYGISRSIVGHLMPNPLYSNILDIHDL